ncbi:MAG: cupin domain-containing protein [Candidatus Acidiferrales bacterium]
MKFSDFSAAKNVWRYNREKLLTNKNMNVAMVEAQKGTSELPHSHDHEQAILVLRGAWRFQMNGQKFTVRENQMLSIPARVEHSALALEDTLAMDICTVPQQDHVAVEERSVPYDADQYLWGV